MDLINEHYLYNVTCISDLCSFFGYEFCRFENMGSTLNTDKKFFIYYIDTSLSN